MCFQSYALWPHMSVRENVRFGLSVRGMDRAAQEKQTNLRYVKDFSAALAEARRPGVQAVFLLNPTRIEQLEAVASAGEVMPQKSTFFFPKLASGLVLDPIDPLEEA